MSIQSEITVREKKSFLSMKVFVLQLYFYMTIFFFLQNDSLQQEFMAFCFFCDWKITKMLDRLQPEILEKVFRNVLVYFQSIQTSHPPRHGKQIRKG